jgi:hypothetical protein
VTGLNDSNQRKRLEDDEQDDALDADLAEADKEPDEDARPYEEVRRELGLPESNWCKRL